MESDQPFVSFVTAHSGTLYRSALMLTREPAAAEDLVQDTFARMYPMWSRVAAADVPLAYVRRSMFNRFLNDKRDRGREVLSAQTPDRVSDVDVAGAIGDRDLVRQLLDELGPRPRAVLVLRYL